MKKIFILSTILTTVLFFQCNNKQKKLTNQNSPTDTTTFFPVNEFIKEDIKDVQQNPYHIYKITNHKPGKRDSTTISILDFTTLANTFLKKDITTPTIKLHYKETIFHDLTTKSIIITYGVTDTSSDIQNVTVLLDDKNNKLKRVFIRSMYNKNDSLFLEQLNWKAGKSFQIIKSINKKNMPEIEEENTVIWNDKPYH